ncbi:hypothetical protein OIV83_003406 [Microbotryomycetes sp. JL201]|nr:hypothetical protein OIV83_003406 [Microbotryomycetes sp. JL201]
MKAVTLHQTQGEWKPGPKCYHPVQLMPVADKDQVLVKVLASAFNHRDLFQRQSLYPGTVFTTDDSPAVMGADAVGICLTPNHPLHNKHVLVAPAVNWLTSPFGPDQGPTKPFGILGAVKQTQGRGTFAEYVVVGKDDIIECPRHFVDGGKQGMAQAAALPLGGLTAYRQVHFGLIRGLSWQTGAVFTKARVEKGQHVLVTGIGGGVAITALQLAVAAGAKVWVSSSSEEKIAKAKELGAQGGVNYKESDWPKKLATMLPKDRPYLDAVIDSGGGDIANQVMRVLKDGGIVSCYGQTTGQAVPISMGFVLKNQEFKGSTMGSRQEFFDSVKFVEQHKIEPVVSDVLSSLDEFEKGFEILKKNSQFGKIVIHVEREGKRKL